MLRRYSEAIALEDKFWKTKTYTPDYHSFRDRQNFQTIFNIRWITKYHVYANSSKRNQRCPGLTILLDYVVLDRILFLFDDSTRLTVDPRYVPSSPIDRFSYSSAKRILTIWHGILINTGLLRFFPFLSSLSVFPFFFPQL